MSDFELVIAGWVVFMEIVFLNFGQIGRFNKFYKVQAHKDAIKCFNGVKDQNFWHQWAH